VIPTPKPGPFTLGRDSQRQVDVPRGSVTKHEWRSTIFPGTIRDYWIYVPAQYESAKEPASMMVFQDGGTYVNEEGPARAPIVFDNLIHQRRLPVTIGIFVNPGNFPPVAPGKDPVSNRRFEYDTMDDKYARFLIEEILPEVGQKYRLSDDPEQRGICGASSGGICSLTVAWQRPDAFRKVLSHVGSFAFAEDSGSGHTYPWLIRKTKPAKPLRVFLQAGSNDLDRDWGSWPIANLDVAAALNFAGYDYKLEFGDGAHDFIHGGAILPESLTWLWR
jgi:enterochelin esterase family protein